MQHTPMSSFVGREEELEKLKNLLTKRSSSLVVIRGRRRVGKSRLIREFGNSAPCYVFSGRPPTKDTSKQHELDSFCEQMAKLFAIPEVKVDSWAKALWLRATRKAS